MCSATDSQMALCSSPMYGTIASRQPRQTAGCEPTGTDIVEEPEAFANKRQALWKRR
jgi:hypothetical protein